MSPAERVLRMIIATVPRRSRPRYREEWLADFTGARELDLPVRSVISGAVATSLLMDRFDPRHSGMSRPAAVARGLRTAFALLAGAGSLGVGSMLWDGLLSTRGWAGGWPATILLTSHIALLALLAAAGLALVFASVLAAPRRRTTLLWGTIALVTHAGLAAILLAEPSSGVLYGAVGGIVTATMIMVHGLASAPRPARRPDRRRIAAAVSCAVIIVAVLVIGAMDITIWNPLARVPGHTLREIHAAMTAAGENPGPWPVIIWCGLWFMVAVGYLVVVVLGRGLWARQPRTVVAVGALLVAGAVIGHWMAGFSMGMGMADTFATSGGNASPSGPIIGSVGQVALVVALLTGLGYPGAPPVSRRLHVPS